MSSGDEKSSVNLVHFGGKQLERSVSCLSSSNCGWGVCVWGGGGGGVRFIKKELKIKKKQWGHRGSEV